MPKVSVIIPAYNAMQFLPETLDSLFKQTFSDYEVIIVNDGSSDGIEQWATQITDLRVKLVSQENQGLAGARNTGLLHAQGEYIAFLDADDLWQPTKLEKQVQVLEDNPEVGLVYTWLDLVDAEGKVRGKVRKNYLEGDVWEKLIEHNIVECGSVAMVRRCCYQAVGFFDQNLPSSYAEDWDMWLRIASHYPFKVVKEPLVYYRAHPNNLSKNWKAMEQSYHIIIEKTFESAPQHLLNLKNRSYGFANLRLAWKTLQNLNGEYQQALYFQQQAILHCPQLRYSKENIRLSLAIMLVRLLGVQGYSRVRNYIYTLKRSLSSL